MAIKFKRTALGITNTWTQMKDIVSNKSLYNESDYAALNQGQKEQYLTMLYANNDALAQRLPEEYNSEYADAETKFALLAAVNSKYLSTVNPRTDEQMNAEINEQLQSEAYKEVGSDKNWIDWLVENKYSGNYVDFIKDYSGNKKYEDALTEMIPSEYNFSEESFVSGMSELKGRESSLREDFANSANIAYDDTLKYVREKL